MLLLRTRLRAGSLTVWDRMMNLPPTVLGRLGITYDSVPCFVSKMGESICHCGEDLKKDELVHDVLELSREKELSRALLGHIHVSSFYSIPS